MKRYEFTVIVGDLIKWISDQGWYPILDFCLRSAEEQKRLFDVGKSKCDGVHNISAHQRGLAVDIYIHDGDENIGKKELYEKTHDVWDSFGGKPMIEWDLGHFEVQK